MLLLDAGRRVYVNDFQLHLSRIGSISCLIWHLKCIYIMPPGAPPVSYVFCSRYRRRCDKESVCSCSWLIYFEVIDKCPSFTLRGKRNQFVMIKNSRWAIAKYQTIGFYFIRKVFSDFTHQERTPYDAYSVEIGYASKGNSPVRQIAEEAKSFQL